MPKIVQSGAIAITRNQYRNGNWVDKRQPAITDPRQDSRTIPLVASALEEILRPEWFSANLPA
jgi:hypothetical protein